MGPHPAAPIYGQVVIGPPGSGKTTYCNGMQQYLRLLGRNAWVVNLDPANERISALMNQPPPSNAKNKDDKIILPYETIFNVCDEVVNITSVMKETGLGPNGGLIYCMEYLEAHVKEVVVMIRNNFNLNQYQKQDKRIYLIFDLPGQVELYTHSTCVQQLLEQLTKALNLRLTAVQLVDAHYCTDASKFLSAALLGTTTMLRLELPTVNVLSKIDLLAGYGTLDLALEFYAECQDLERLVPFIENQASQRMADVDNEEDEYYLADDPEYQAVLQKRRQNNKFAKLHRALAEVIQDFGLLHFLPLDISDAASVGRVLAQVDKCNGYVFVQGESTSIPSNLLECAIQQDMPYEALSDVKERILHNNKQE